MKRSSYLTGLGVLTAMALGLPTLAQPRSSAPGITLYSQFQHPPASARPRVWWHWMNGNISKNGIRQDLLWMHRSGIGGVQNFDAGLDTPPVIDNRLMYMTPGWQEAFRYTTHLADSLKLEMAIAGSPGWSESGGPWVKPEAGMKKYVWSETRLSGGATGIQLPKPPTTTGAFQNLPMQAGLGEPIDRKASPTFYRDAVVVAYKLPETNKTLVELGAVVTASSGQFTLQQLTDGDLFTTSLLPSDTVKGYAWIEFGFPQPQTIRAVTLVGGGDRGPFGLFGELKDTRSVEVSDDGKTYKWVCYLPAGGVLQQTIAIPATTARYFRITFKNPPVPPDLASMFGIPGMPPPKAPPGTDVAELALSPVGRVHRLEEKAAFAPAEDLITSPTPDIPTGIMPEAVIDLTSRLRTDGSLDWTVPPGNWNIVRLGYSLLGITNHPASPEATGLEVDKLNPAAIRDYFTQYLDLYRRATGGMMGNSGVQYMITDSWEAGAQNWTQNLPQEFQQRRGYSLLPWIPVLTGTVVKSSDASDRFLHDFRKTLSEMLAEYHYDGLTNLLNEYGMKRYSESHEDRRAMIADGMDVKRTAAVPMSAMWMPKFPGDDRIAYIADIRESASVAHIYGQNLVAAESFTASGVGGKAFSYAPEHIKPTADLELANGLNRFVIHTSVHQPDDRKIPGIGLGSVGQWFTRHETWAGQASVWTDYLARSSHLLQQGRAVADVVYYYGEDNNITGLFGKKLPDVPAGYNYDFINPHALINLLSVKNGKLVTPSGMSYRVLHLDSNARQMSLPVLRKIARLVRDGAFISGIKPQRSVGLGIDEQEFARLVTEVWGSANPRVHTGKTTGDVLRALTVQPDFTYTKSQPNTQLLYVHRTLADGELYWVNNRSDQPETVTATFRVSGKKPKIWHPETGRTEAASYTIANGFTTVSLNLTPNDAVFVVFRAPATTPSLTLPAVIESELATLDGPWQVAFQPNRGAPAKATFDKLRSFTENGDKGIAFFSGTATYTQTVRIPAENLTKGKPVWLDLGDVKNLAEVLVNGKALGVVWKKPFRIDVSSALKTGENSIDIRVTNLWVNRLIGDAQPGTTNRITFTTMPFYKPDSPLLPSGLLGPVRLIRID